jgi:predicted amidohydrolase
MAGEDKVYRGGNKQLTVPLKEWHIRPFICYDLRFPTWIRNLDNAYDLALFVANWPQPRALQWQTLLKARAIENLSFVVGLNRVGRDGNGVDYSGDSAVIAPDGEALAELNADDVIHTVTLAKDSLSAYRRRFPAYLDMDRDMIRGPF